MCSSHVICNPSLYRVSGRVIEGSEGYVHMEKNWGRSFPSGWIWTQAATTKPEKVLNQTGSQL